jgi:DNA-directed RNA polymerase sigma subunit (sigma70/sigma32)
VAKDVAAEANRQERGFDGPLGEEPSELIPDHHHDALPDHDEVNDVLDRLDPLERKILRQAFGLDGEAVRQKELAACFGLSIRQVVRLAEQALCRARGEPGSLR